VRLTPQPGQKITLSFQSECEDDFESEETSKQMFTYKHGYYEQPFTPGFTFVALL